MPRELTPEEKEELKRRQERKLKSMTEKFKSVQVSDEDKKKNMKMEFSKAILKSKYTKKKK